MTLAAVVYLMALALSAGIVLLSWAFHIQWLLLVAFAIGIVALGWFLRWMREYPDHQGEN